MTGDYSLAYGTHASPEEGRCAMEWVSHLAGEPHSDQPVCVSPVLRALCIALNDGLDDERRQRLRPYLTRTIGTASDELDPVRAWMAMDWLIRTYTPTWLELAGLEDAAAALRALPPVLDEVTLHAALAPLMRGRDEARAGRGGGWSAGLAAGRGGGRSAGLAAGRAAARETAWGCAGAAAWAAARLGIGDMAGDRARAAARSAAADAAATAAQNALQAQAPHGRAAARDAARRALAPTLTELEASVLALLERMLPTERIEIPLATAVAHA